MKDIKNREYVIQLVNQNSLSKTENLVTAETYMNSLDIKMGLVATENILSENDNRTVAHELGHIGGLDYQKNTNNLMTQK